MKANELRIGNLIQWKSTGDIHSVQKIETFKRRVGKVNDISISDCQPIPLTEEWLFKFGFTSHQSFLYEATIFTFNYKNGTFQICPLFKDEKPLNEFALLSCKSINIKFVHQLQNVIFALTGEELPLK